MNLDALSWRSFGFLVGGFLCAQLSGLMVLVTAFRASRAEWLDVAVDVLGALCWAYVYLLCIKAFRLAEAEVRR